MLIRKVIKYFYFICILSLSLVLLLFSNPYAQEFQKSIWLNNPEGWHFYKEKKHKYVEPEPSKEESFSQDFSQEELFTQRMKKEGERLLSKAMESLDIESVYNYIEFQKQMIDKSQQFADVWELVVSLYPHLTYPENPAHPKFRPIEYKYRDEQIKAAINSLSERAGIFFIYSSTCPFCQKQAQELSKFYQEFPNFVIKPITVDGGVLPEFPDSVFDVGFAFNLNIKSLPAIILYFPDKQGFLRVSEGAMDLTTLKRRLVLYEKLYEDQKLDTYLTFVNY